MAGRRPVPRLLVIAVSLVLELGGRARLMAEERYEYELFRRFLNHHTVTMLLIEPESGAIVAANDAAVGFYGYPRSKLLAMRIQDINRLDPEDVAAERAKAVAEKRNYFIFPHRLASGEVRTVEVYSSPVTTKEGRTLLLSIILDVSGRRVAEAEMAAYTERLAYLVDERAAALAESRALAATAAASAIVSLVVILGLFAYLRSRRRVESILRAGEERSRALFNEFLHRVKNSMQSIASLIALEQSRTNDARTITTLETLHMRVLTLSSLYTLLHKSGETDRIDLAGYLDEVADSLDSAYGAETMGVRIEQDLHKVLVDAKRASACGLALNELLTNALKYAFTGGQGGTIRIRLRHTDGLVSLLVSDDGRGLPEDFDFKTQDGFGLFMVRGLAEQLHGSLRREASTKGTAFLFTFAVDPDSGSADMRAAASEAPR